MCSYQVVKNVRFSKQCTYVLKNDPNQRSNFLLEITIFRSQFCRKSNFLPVNVFNTLQLGVAYLYLLKTSENLKVF